MENQVLNLILKRLDNIDKSLKDLYYGQDGLKNGQDSLRNGQLYLIKEQEKMKKQQAEMRKEQAEMRKDIKGLRDDIDTVYTLQQEDHKILLRHENILNIHTKQLNRLIDLAEENKLEHAQFDKRISRLEAIVS